MKNLMTTTAMVIALGMPVAGYAQTVSTTTETSASATSASAGAETGFLAERGLNEMLATDLMGKDVYVRQGAAETNGEAATMTAADLENMDNIGQINDLVLSNDGSVLAVVIGIGGFLGVAEQDVAVTMDQVSFATNADDMEETYVVVNTSVELLQSSPAFDRTAVMNGATGMQDADTAATDMESSTDADADVATDDVTDREMLTAPDTEREGYTAVTAADVSVDDLIGKTVYDAEDTNIGTVDDVIVGDNGSVQDVIIDFGGFLGLGATQVALNFEEMTMLTNEDDDLRVYVSATEEQLEAMPTYSAND
ncbi:MAG: PRC-barrel domain-containing protein [Paracoccaceae bacterium]|uniref:PRC-barrel domain-containing protein n=1 Tax=Seohaeicola saemankumensis TaxID=481181 RepID=UPI001E2BBAE2|nr:PRC-barrel domain-containing protein [Seohaeicola saemankumensis]MCD1624569.1 PRC-barrel domain-containing protein [Seohaeicola saemankumensis]